MRMMCYSVMTQAYSEKEIPSSPNRSRTYDLPITSSDALPLSYRRLVGAKAIIIFFAIIIFAKKAITARQKVAIPLGVSTTLLHHLQFLKVATTPSPGHKIILEHQ